MDAQESENLSSSNIVATAMSTAKLSLALPRISNSPVHSTGSPHYDIIQRLSPSPVHQHSIQLSDQMDVERQASPQPCIDERAGNSPQPTQQESHSIVIEPRKDKFLIIAEPSHTITKDVSSPVTSMSAGSPLAKVSETNQEVRQIVLINDSTALHQTVPVSKDGHLLPPSPAHTPQPAPPTVMSENEHGVRALVVYNKKGEVHDPIIQYVPNPPREESSVMKEEAYPITCGNSKGEIFWKKFICPGINAKCVKCNGQWLTPKEFVQEAGKMTLKDWKRAIRINGTMLRKMIESGEVDYFQHESNCSNQCRSNKGPSLESTASQGSFDRSFDNDPTKERSTDISMLERSNSEENPNYLTTKRNPMLTGQKMSLDSSKSLVSSLERSSSEDSGLAASPQLDGVIMRESIATAERLQDLQTFWSGIIRSDLFDEVTNDILQRVNVIHSRAKKTSPAVSAEDAVTLTNLANALELVPGILQKTATQKISIERQSEHTTHVIMDLERQLAEQKKYDHDLKRKSQVLDSVIKVTANEKRKRPKMVRLFRQKAVDRPATGQLPPGASGQTIVPVSRISTADMASVMQTPLMRYSGQELWGTPSGTVAHVLQNHIPTHNMILPLPPHLLPTTREHAQFQMNQDSSKK